MRALVTGVAGFIGSSLAERLIKDGHEVIGIDCFTDYYSQIQKERNISSLLKSKKFSFIERDLMIVDLIPILKKVDYVFHEAAQPGVRGSWGKNFSIYVINNIEVTQHILEACKEVKIKKLVYASSSSIYGNCSLPMSEEQIPHPISPYGVTKLSGENLCYLYAEQYDIPIVSLRYFSIYGTRQRPDMLIHRLLKSLIDDSVVTIFGDGEQTRDYTFIGDAVEANLLALHAAMPFNIFNVGSDSRVSVNSLIKLIGEVTGKIPNINYSMKQMGDVRDTYADISKASRVLGYVPRTPLKLGLKLQYEYLKRLNKLL
jgi:nucleoside-diphosphate-sugar epimerase